MVKIFRNCDPMADCKPVVFMSCFLLTFWLLLSYVTNSYFAIFLMVSNFILIFGCCVSLSGYVVGQLLDTRRETGQLIEVTTISAPQPFVRPPEYPPSYDDAIRLGWQHCMNQNGGDGVVLCIPLENDPRINPLYMNLPYGTPVETPHVPLPYNRLPSIPSYEMSISSATAGSTLPLYVTPRSNVSSDALPDIPSYEMSIAGSNSPLNLNTRSRSNVMSDLESSTTVVESLPTLQTLTALPDSTITISDLESTTVIPVAPSASRTLTPHSRLTSENDTDSNLKNPITSSAITDSNTSPQISRFCVSSESTVLCLSANESVTKLEQLSRSVSEDHYEKDSKMCVDIPTSSQDLEFQRHSSSLPSKHASSLSRSLSFPGIR
ncbi:hypothetical protein LSTR_LSTR002015 [Laodelphax striatellus]|uniref:Uncharacterized protein n=1 Tax=Laodelphax striatellus TaxID=195883 RepID=A0A482XHD3_LAOST|nr:hypothetical protein LSTR_LSTR002015 [Laodelphax striatellus]